MKTHFIKLIFSLTFILSFESKALANNTFTCSADSIKAVDDIVSTRKNTGVTFRPVQNDYLVGVFLGVSIIEPPRHGSIAFTTVDVLLYQPEGGFCGKDTLRYRVCTTTKCDSAYVYIGVSCEAGFLAFPIAHNDFVTAPKNAIFTFNPLENDQLGGTILGTGIVKEPKYGSATFRPNELIYVPRPESCGKDTMTYRVCNDKYQCDTASIFFNIACDVVPTPVPVIVTYRMRLDAPSPTGEVYLTGDFLKDGKHGVNWGDPSVLPLKKTNGDNFYTFTDTVLSKQYQFKFLKGKNWADSTGAILVETARFDRLGCGTANNSGVSNRVLDLTGFKTAFSQIIVTYDWNKCTPGLSVPLVVSTASSPVLGGRTFGGGSYYQGDSVLVKAIASEGYRFLHWDDNAVTVSQDSVYRFLMGNSNRSLMAIFSKSTAVEDFSNAQYSVYPNPTSGVFYVTSANQPSLDLKEWSVIDALGRKILRGSSFKETGINLGAFKEGIYLFQIITDKGQIVKRIVLTH
jgi:Divergent InlB B-repeat domain/Secretion system C-terminal sorting domain/Bacterial Ig domain